MVNVTKNANLAKADVEFEPYCEWRKDDGSDTLVVHLPAFKKDQLRVQVNNLGALKVSGARAVDGGHMSRFVKETKIPQGCNVNHIRAKFINGHLHVIMPTKVVTTSSSPPKLETAEKQKAEKLQSQSDENDKVATMNSNDQEKESMKKVSVSFGIAMLAMVAIGVYVAYKCGTDSSCPPPPHIEDYFQN